MLTRRIHVFPFNSKTNFITGLILAPTLVVPDPGPEQGEDDVLGGLGLALGFIGDLAKRRPPTVLANPARGSWSQAPLLLQFVLFRVKIILKQLRRIVAHKGEEVCGS